MDHTQVQRYVSFDVTRDTLIAMGPQILQQGGGEVPIGGFLSALLTKLWCLYKEHHHLFGKEKREVEKTVDERWHAVYPLLAPKLVLSGTTDFTITPILSLRCETCGGGLPAPRFSAIIN